MLEARTLGALNTDPKNAGWIECLQMRTNMLFSVERLCDASTEHVAARKTASPMP